MLLTKTAAARRALEVVMIDRPDEGRWEVTSIRWRPILPVVPSPFNPEDSYLNVGGYVRELRGLMPPAWQVQMQSTNDHTYDVLLAMRDGRMLASVSGVFLRGTDGS
jgi:hypothetical protein